jgi:riboflavin kinase/FMN adenylyltransferase
VEFAIPASGVYAGWATVGGTRHSAAISVGLPPTFPDASCPVEAHLLGFEGDLYGQPMMLEFAERLREQRAFESAELLAEAIHDDVERAARILADR